MVSGMIPFIMQKLSQTLKYKTGKHRAVWPFTGKKVKPTNNSAVCDHLLHCNYLPTSVWQLSYLNSWEKRKFSRNSRDFSSNER